VERARAAAAQRLAAAESLPAALLREVFDGPQASGWETRTLGELLHRYNEIIHPGDRKSGEAVFVGLDTSSLTRAAASSRTARSSLPR
jgi:hypothetical protein